MRANDAERAVADLAAYQHGVISRSQAASMGMSAPVLRRRVTSGLWWSPFPNVFVSASAQPSWHQDAMIATLARDGAVLSHRAAARLHGLDGFREAPVEISISRTGGRHGVANCPTHVVKALRSCDVAQVGAVAVTTIPRTLCDLGTVVGAFRLEQALDSALRRGVAVTSIRRAAERLHRPGQRGTKAILQLLDDPLRVGRVPDSWFERLVERIVRDPSLPPVVRQHEIRHHGEFVARVDLAMPSVKLVIECHSREFHFGPRNERLDELREHKLVAAGWLTLYLGYAATRTPAQVLTVVKQAVAARSVA